MLEQEKRARRRAGRISGGVDDLEIWLRDLVRGGLAEAASRPWTSFEQMSERLVDAQAPGLARLVRDLGGLPHRTTAWPERMLIDLGRLWLLLEASRRQEFLDPDLRHEVRTLIGIAERREDVLGRPAVHDAWDVVGRRLIVGERLSVLRTWLWGRHTRRWALLLAFLMGGQSPQRDPHQLTPGSTVEAGVYFFNGTARLRALIDEPPVLAGSVTGLPGRSVQDMLRVYAEWLGRNPWQERIPAALSAVVPHRARAETWCLIDAADTRVRMAGPAGWHLMALSGGHPVDVFGEWDGFCFWPLGAMTEGRLVSLRSAAAA